MDGPQTQNLAFYPGGTRTALAFKDMGDWSALYSASPVINPEMIRELLSQRLSNVALSSNDWSMINDQFICFHTYGDGVRRIRLPSSTALYEVVRDQEIPANTTHSLRVKGAKTYIFFRGTKAEWERGK